MSSILINIADAIVFELNTPEQFVSGDYVFMAFSQAIAAARTYDTERKLEESELLQVDVVAGDIKQDVGTRSAQDGTYRIDIAFRQTIDASDTASLDALGALVEEVGDYFFQRKRLRGLTHAMWKHGDVVYPYLPDRIRSDDRFVSLLRLTYRVIQ